MVLLNTNRHDNTSKIDQTKLIQELEEKVMVTVLFASHKGGLKFEAQNCTHALKLECRFFSEQKKDFK